jgi:hypothetical protein
MESKAEIMPHKPLDRRCNTYLEKGFRLGLLTLLCLPFGCKPDEVVQQEIAAEQAAQNKPTEAPLPDQKAGVGVGVKGRSLEGGSEYNPATFVSGPAAAFFRTKEKIVFEIQLPQAQNLYYAEKGRHPRSHEEFMRDIIEFNRIKLPQLPQGRVYRYRPDSNELWVESENSKEQATESNAPQIPNRGDE